MMTLVESLDGAVVRPIPYVARAWWGDRLVAESSATKRLQVPGVRPTLWFPADNVVTSAFTSRGLERWSGGHFEKWDVTADLLAGCPDPAPASNGAGVMRVWYAAPPGLEALNGMAWIDDSQARVEIVDGRDGDDPRDVTVKRFPTWGDAGDLVAVLGGGVAIANPERPVVEGSQVLGQAVVAAMRQSPGRRVVSAHMAFLRVADANLPVDIELAQLAGGRSFSAVQARAVQDQQRLIAAGTLLLGTPAADVVQHTTDLDGVAGPYDAVPYDMGVVGRDLRVVDAAYTDDPKAPVGPPSIDAWVRFRDVPDDPAINAGLLAQFTGHMPIAAALRPHAGVGQAEAHRTISTAINAIAISLHADVRMTDWVLYRHLATVVRDGMAHAECRAYNEAGTLLASFSVDAMIRPLDLAAPDARTAL